MNVPARFAECLLITFLIIFLSFSGCSNLSPTVTEQYTLPKVLLNSMPPVEKIILIGWDGIGRDRIKEGLLANQLPNLKYLSSEGNLVAIDIYRTTDSATGWSQILTGYEPEVTGVFNNYRYGPIPKGYTIFERLEDFFGPEKFVTVAVIGKQRDIENAPELKKPYQEGDRVEGKIITEGGLKYQLIPAKPYYNATASMDIFVNGLNHNDKVAGEASKMLEQYKDKPFFFFIHFAWADYMGHEFGEGSKEYSDAIKSDDEWTGRIIQKVKELGIYDKTLIYITADHGFDKEQKSHDDAPYVFLGTNDPMVMRRGERADIAATILERFGMELSQIDPPLDGHPLTAPYQLPLW